MHLRLARRCLGAGGVLLLLGLESTVAVVARHEWQSPGSSGPRGLADAVALTAAVATLVLGLWLLAGLCAAVLALAPGRAGALASWATDAWTPALCRRWAALLMGATLGAGPGAGLVAGAAMAASPTPAATATAAVTSASSSTQAPPAPSSTPAPPAPSSNHAPPAPGWTPSRPGPTPRSEPRLVVGPTTDRAPVTAAVADVGDRREVVVHRGDSLWAMVRRALGPEASDAEVARTWPRWYAANRHMIGDDPSLIRPGQRLRPPGGAPAGPDGVAAPRVGAP